VDRVDPIAPDRTVPRVELTHLKPLERERERQRRERERKRRQDAAPKPKDRPDPPNSGIDVRV
jgi:hypothetical protein